MGGVINLTSFEMALDLKSLYYIQKFHFIEFLDFHFILYVEVVYILWVQTY